MFEHVNELLHKLFGGVAHGLAQEKVHHQVVEGMGDMAAEVTQDKLLKRFEKPSGESTESGQGFLVGLSSLVRGQGLFVVLAGAVLFALVGTAFIFIKDLFHERFFLHVSNLIFIGELFITLLFMAFVPFSVVGVVAPVILKIQSQNARNLIVAVLFVSLLFAVSYISNNLFPALIKVWTL